MSRLFDRPAAFLGLIFLTALVTPCLASSAADPKTPQTLIRQAGNTENDDTRLEILKQLRTHPGLDAALRADVDKMVAFVDRWQHDKSLWSWYQREIREKADYDFGIKGTSPLAPLASFYRGRMLFWVTNERSGAAPHTARIRSEN